MKKILCFSIVFIVSFFLLQDSSFANRRRFAYTYESPVLAKGAREIELWNTLRRHKVNYFRAIDNRTEFEFGLGSNLQTSLYLNLSSKAFDEGGAIASENSLSVSNEWKYKLLDRTADPLGLALYGEATIATTEFELEGKLIVDKQIGDLLIAFNAVYENEMETELENGVVETVNEPILEFDLGIAYAFTPEFSVGLEGRYHSVKPPEFDPAQTYSALFLGPNVSYSGSNWWAVLSFMPQVTGTAGDASTAKLDLEEHVKMESRLLLSFDF